MIQSLISPALEVQSCIKNELTFRNHRHHRLRTKKRAKSNGQAWDKAPNFAPPGDDMSVFCVAKFQTHPFSGKSRFVPKCDRREISRRILSGMNEVYMYMYEVPSCSVVEEHPVGLRWSYIQNGDFCFCKRSLW